MFSKFSLVLLVIISTLMVSVYGQYYCNNDNICDPYEKYWSCDDCQHLGPLPNQNAPLQNFQEPEPVVETTGNESTDHSIVSLQDVNGGDGYLPRNYEETFSSASKVCAFALPLAAVIAFL